MSEFSMERAEKARAKRKKKVRESVIEADGTQRVKEQGGFSAKFKSPGHRSRPDRIEFYGVEPIMQITGFTREAAVALLASAIQLTEYKQPGVAPTAAQLREHERYRALGFTVNVIDQRTEK